MRKKGKYRGREKKESAGERIGKVQERGRGYRGTGERREYSE